MVKVKVYCPKDEQGKLQQLMKIDASYDEFIIADVDRTQLRSLKRKYPVEDMSKSNLIRLKNKNIDLTAKTRRDKGALLRRQGKQLSKGAHHYIVRFVGPIKKEWLDSITKIGGIPSEPLPNFSYIFEMDQKTLSRVSKFSYVTWIGHYDAAYRIAPSVLDRASNPDTKQDTKKLIRKFDRPSDAGKRTKFGKMTEGLTKIIPNKYSITFFSDKNLKDARHLITKNGIKIVDKPSNNRIIIDLHKSKKDAKEVLSNLAMIHGVKEIQDVKVRKLFNNIAAKVMNADYVYSSLRLTGKGEIIGIADTGLDSGDAQTIHPDFRGRIKELRSYPINSVYDGSLIKNAGSNDGVKDTSSGHGTHVAGSVLGDGSSSVASKDKDIVKGIAYEAKLLFQAVEQWMNWTDEARVYWLKNYGTHPPEFGLYGLPTNIAELFKDAYTKGCRIHTNSWGGGDPGIYDEQCQDLDKFVWEHKDFTILFAAGNDGTDANFDGKIDFGSVTSPGTAKNCITVGASENERTEFISEKYGGVEWWPDNYPLPPIRNDPMTDNAGGDIVAFSSRGPTADGRIKPDVVAPGTFILSTRSRYIATNNTGWAKYPKNKDYFFMGGTSMATPLVAGACAILRQYLRKKKKMSRPSAALIKATLIHGAERLNYRYSADLRKGHYDMEQGWGLVNLKSSINPQSGKVKFFDAKKGLKTGESNILKIVVASSSIPLKVTMVYSDFPGPTIINNLNLVVTDPTGKRYNGNVFEEPFDSRFDITNNVETIFIKEPKKGEYTIEVIGSNIAEKSQDFALVYSGGLK
ncbi:MAG TPA: S8 family serine peptidase [Nitrososphaeraceae archaeon]|nr:S8 family serine peptidase [Nitrososphaeraceae archaeon]